MSTISASTTNTTAYTVDADTTGKLTFKTGSSPTTAMTIDTSQNVGIGTSTITPVGSGYTTLSIEGGNGGNLQLGASSLKGQLWFNTDLYIDSATGAQSFRTSSTERMRIDSSGNVGIGTSSPLYRLSVRQPTLTATVAEFRTIDGTNNPGLEIKTSSAGTTLAQVYSSGATANLMFETNGSERARIDSSGNLLVGTTSNGSSSRLFVEAASGSSEVAGFRWGSGTTFGNVRFLNGSSTTIGYIQWYGSSTLYSTSSDYRLKENIAPMIGALARVAALKPVTYTWKADGSAGQGFIAHELQEVVPDCVTGEKDAVETYIDEEGNEQTRPVYQGIDTSFLVATLTAAIQEQQAIIEQLTARIETLEAK